jgi:hypothetical protein
MQSILPSAAALAVAVIFYSWRAWNFAQYRRQRSLHQRVAYMLWVVANTDGTEVAAAH